MLERIQRQAIKWILNDYQSSYRSRLMSLHLLPLMYIYELNDIIFFIKCHNQPSSHFNINKYIKLSTSSTRSDSSNKMVHHKCSFHFLQNFYFHCLQGCGTHYHKQIYLFPQIPSKINCTSSCGIILMNSLMTPMLIHFIISVLVVTVQQSQSLQFTQNILNLL